jgi:adhesin transport system outer membrane protein
MAFPLQFKSPRQGAFLRLFIVFGAALCGSVPTLGADRTELASPVMAGSAEALRVRSVADQLIGFLDGASAWADGTGARLSLPALVNKVETAVNNHPEVRLATTQRDTAAMATREAYAGFLPQLSANVETGNKRNAAVSTPWSSTPAYRDNSKALVVTGRQLLYDFGAVSKQVDAQQVLESAADARAQIKRSDLTLRALTVWLELFRGQQALSLAQMNVASRSQLLAFIEEREQLGASSKSEVLRARARLSDAQVAQVAAQNRLTLAEAAYKEVFNELPAAKLALPALAPLDLATLSQPSQWLDSNPVLLEARAKTQAAGLEAQAAAAALLPGFYFEFNARRRDLDGPGVPGTDWSAGVVAKQNLYSGGADVARQQQAQQRAIESQLEEDNLRRQLDRGFAQALADVNNSAVAIGARKDAVQVASAAFSAVREQFGFRRGTLLDVLRAQEEVYLAGRDLIDGVVDQSLARFRLLHVAMQLTPLFESTEPVDRQEKKQP